MNGRQAEERHSAWAIGLVIVLFLVACEPPPSPATSFSQTGPPIEEPFGDFYSSHGGAQVFGNAITGACKTDDGRVIQYFQRMRLEQNAEGEGVEVFPLGEWAFSGVRKHVPAPTSSANSERRFSSTGHMVQDEFLAFYETHAGNEILGPPISDQLVEGELRVQYFRNGRLEWHPEAPQALRVQISMLGQAHVDAGGIDHLDCDHLAQLNDRYEGVTVDVDASLKRPILYAGQEQTVFVEVTTSDRAAVADVPVQLTVFYQGETFTMALGRTDAEGRVSGPLVLPDFEPGREVEVEVSARTDGGSTIGTTTLSFQTWW